jgi:hypothetical protein
MHACILTRNMVVHDPELRSSFLASLILLNIKLRMLFIEWYKTWHVRLQSGPGWNWLLDQKSLGPIRSRLELVVGSKISRFNQVQVGTGCWIESL